MKELSIKEKVKAYDEVVNKLKGFMAQGVDPLITRADVQDFFPELKESEDERIRKKIIQLVNDAMATNAPYKKEMLAWLEKQGEHDNFRNKIQVGDKVTRNEDGVLVNLSQLNRVAKKQGEQETLCDKCKKEQPSHFCQDITALGRCALEMQGEQKPAWSEEDEEIHRKCICAMRASACGFPEEEKFVEQVDNWLKSLKYRYTWKPSDEQVDAIRYVSNFDYGGHKATLVSLYEQLKKLREE